MNKELKMNLVTNKTKKQVKGKRPLTKPKLSIKNTFRLIWIYLRSFKNWLWAELAVSLFAMLIGVGNYFAMQYAILGLSANQPALVFTIGGILIGLFFLMWGFSYAQYSILVHVGQNVGQKIRNDVFAKVQKLPIQYFDTHNSGDLMSRFTNDINTITTAIAENMTDVIGNMFWTVGMGIMMLIISPYLTLITIALIPIFMIVIIVLVKKSQPIFQKQQIAFGALNGFLEEYLSGQDVIDLYLQGDQAMGKYKKYIGDIQEVSYKAQFYSGLLIPWGAFMTGFITLFTTTIGIIFIANNIGLGGITIELNLDVPPPAPSTGDTPAAVVDATTPSGGTTPTPASNGFQDASWAGQFSSLTIYLVLLKYFVQPFSQIANVLNIFQAALAGAGRAFEVFNEKEETNPLEKIVINIAGSNLPIEVQKQILETKLQTYKQELTVLESQLKTHPKLMKKEDIRWLKNWVVNMKCLKKAFNKYIATLKIFKQDATITPLIYEQILWLQEQLGMVQANIHTDMSTAQIYYRDMYLNLSKFTDYFTDKTLSSDPVQAQATIDGLSHKLDDYLNRQLRVVNYPITLAQIQDFNKFKLCLLELEIEKNKLNQYLTNHYTASQKQDIYQMCLNEFNRQNIVQTFKDNEALHYFLTEQKTSIESFNADVYAINVILHQIINYSKQLIVAHQKDADKLLKQTATHQGADVISTQAMNIVKQKAHKDNVDKKDMKEVYNNLLADYYMTVKSLAMFDSKSIQDIHANIVLDHLTFGYDDIKKVLKDVNLDVKAGQTIAIVGPTGSGKSTIINLLTKFYDIREGDIVFDGLSIRDISKESLRRNISIVLQDTYLFNESVKENIRFGNLEASDDMIVEAAKLANCHEFIMNLSQGYDTIIENNGEGLSQGQRQLLAIARAILSPSSVLILDEATSSIDTKTEKDIQEAMERLMQNKTTFMIAHRLSTVRNATKIVVLKDGQIIEVGNHDELLQIPDGFYAKLYNSQFGDDLDLELD